MTKQAVILFVCAYFLGAIPFGFIIGKLVRKIDIRNYGSGNIGATNVLRVLGPFWGSVSFLFDVLKGFIPTYVASRMGMGAWIVILAGAIAVFGHTFSVFLRFKGGKGVASSLGVIFGFNYSIALLGLLVFVIVLAATRYVSVSSCLATLSVFIMTLFWQWPPSHLAYKLVVGLLLLAIIVKHSSNFKRLANGTENKFGQKARINNSQGDGQ